MFFVLLTVAGFQLLCAVCVYMVAKARTPALVSAATAVGVFGVLFLTSVVASPVVFFQGIALAVIGAVCTGVKARQIVFAASSLTASVIVMGLVGWSAAHAWSGLRERYPFVSMSQRLDYESKAANRDVAGPQADQRPATLNLKEATLARLAEAEEHRSWNRRRDALRLVHASAVEQFVESPGFGVGRMIRPSPYSIEHGDNRALARFELEPRPDADGSPEPAGRTVFTADVVPAPSIFVGALDQMHDDARNDFVDDDGFGYVRDRDHVSGFVPHGFLNCVPNLSIQKPTYQNWLTVRVELISMLKHERPVAYVSTRLPNMSELRDAPVRELDVFELRALASLGEGEDLCSEVQPGRIRALGSLRAMKQCIQCHEVERGTLLGAFSYEFIRDPPIQAPKKAPSNSADDAELL